MSDTPKGRRSWKSSISAKAVDIVVIIVSATWAGSFVADMFILNYDPPTGLHQVMMLLIGFIVAGRTQLEKKDDESDDKEKEKEKP